ncbi:MAG: ATP synthase F0 subunit B [Deltaproteobacteria bacterium]|nr:ATP synthase F0 subunit B [Deltaproteobacteria bacterium]
MNYLDSPYLQRVFDFDILHMELNTFLFMLVVILIVMVSLNTLLFRPILRTLDNRAALKNSLEKGVSGSMEEIQSLTEKYQLDLAKVLDQVASVRGESHKTTQKVVSEILEKSREESQQNFQQSLGELQKQMEAVRVQLADEARTLADKAAQKLLGA